jgi:anti-sigma regulatory factor (Ser/Thr protein kinase)
MASVMTSQTYTVTYAGRPDQVRRVRWLLAALLDGCPVADDAILLASELAANAVNHSNSGKPGGTFTFSMEIHPDYVWIEIEDQGGKWEERPYFEGHGLDVVSKLADEWAIEGNEKCRVASFRLDWSLAV